MGNVCQPVGVQKAASMNTEDNSRNILTRMTINMQ